MTIMFLVCQMFDKGTWCFSVLNVRNVANMSMAKHLSSILNRVQFCAVLFTFFFIFKTCLNVES
jgi:hypothetical protein